MYKDIKNALNCIYEWPWSKILYNDDDDNDDFVNNIPSYMHWIKKKHTHPHTVIYTIALHSVITKFSWMNGLNKKQSHLLSQSVNLYWICMHNIYKIQHLSHPLVMNSVPRALVPTGQMVTISCNQKTRRQIYHCRHGPGNCRATEKDVRLASKLAGLSKLLFSVSLMTVINFDKLLFTILFY